MGTSREQQINGRAKQLPEKVAAHRVDGIVAALALIGIVLLVCIAAVYSHHSLFYPKLVGVRNSIESWCPKTAFLVKLADWLWESTWSSRFSFIIIDFCQVVVLYVLVSRLPTIKCQQVSREEYIVYSLYLVEITFAIIAVAWILVKVDVDYNADVIINSMLLVAADFLCAFTVGYWLSDIFTTQPSDRRWFIRTCVYPIIDMTLNLVIVVWLLDKMPGRNGGVSTLIQALFALVLTRYFFQVFDERLLPKDGPFENQIEQVKDNEEVKEDLPCLPEVVDSYNESATECAHDSKLVKAPQLLLMQLIVILLGLRALNRRFSSKK